MSFNIKKKEKEEKLDGIEFKSYTVVKIVTFILNKSLDSIFYTEIKRIFE